MRRAWSARRVNYVSNHYNSLRPTLIAALCAAVAAAVAFPSMARAEVKVDGSVTVVESAQASGPVLRATKDLLSDFNKVFGTTPRVVKTLAEAGPVSIVIGQGPEMPFGLKCSMATDTEGLRFRSLTCRARARGRRCV